MSGIKDSRVIFFIFGFAIFAGIAVCVASYTRLRTASVRIEASPLFEIANADLVSAVSDRGDRSISVSGVLQPLRKTMLSAEVEGRVDTVNVRVGDSLALGAVLARMDTRDYERRLVIERANMSAARAQFEAAELAHHRNEELVSRGFISVSASDNTKNALEIARETLNVREAQYALAQQAKQKTTVLAPLSGIVAERAVNPGQYVSLSTPLFTIIDLSELEFVAKIPTKAIGDIRIGQQVTLSIEGITEGIQGRVDRIAPSADDESRMIALFVRVENTSASRLRAGMTAGGTILIPNSGSGIFISKQAIRYEQGIPFLLVLKGERIIRHNVTLGIRDDLRDLIEITSNLTPGDRALLAKIAPPEPNHIVRIFAGTAP